jgi:CheY-like chemotaxis protein
MQYDKRLARRIRQIEDERKQYCHGFLGIFNANVTNLLKISTFYVVGILTDTTAEELEWDSEVTDSGYLFNATIQIKNLIAAMSLNMNSRSLAKSFPMKSSESDDVTSILEYLKQKRTLSILIVDDSIVVRKVYGKAFKFLKHNIEIARHGEQAISMMSAKDFHVVFMDINMPGMGGIETTLKIREMEASQHEFIQGSAMEELSIDQSEKKNKQKRERIRIIGISASEDCKEFALRAGMDSFISKAAGSRLISAIFECENV